MFLIKCRPVTNNFRKKKYISSDFTNFKKISKLSKVVLKKIGKIYKGAKKGQIVLRSRFSGSKKKLILDSRSFVFSNEQGICINLIKDTNKSANLALIKYASGSYKYILSPQFYFSGFCHQSYFDLSSNFNQKRCKLANQFMVYKNSYVVFITQIRFRWAFYNVMFKYARAAGTYCKIVLGGKQFKFFKKIRLPSGKRLLTKSLIGVTLGRSSNMSHRFSKNPSYKLNFFRGFRPSVRGVAMNPVDHPNGGRTKTNSPVKNIWGKIAKNNK